jgi:hypothetical protein
VDTRIEGHGIEACGREGQVIEFGLNAGPRRIEMAGSPKAILIVSAQIDGAG